MEQKATLQSLSSTRMQLRSNAVPAALHRKRAHSTAEKRGCVALTLASPLRLQVCVAGCSFAVLIPGQDSPGVAQGCSFHTEQHPSDLNLVAGRRMPLSPPDNC